MIICRYPGLVVFFWIYYSQYCNSFVCPTWLVEPQEKVLQCTDSSDIIEALAWAPIVIDFAVHTCENDSWTRSMIESKLSLFPTENKLLLPWI